MTLKLRNTSKKIYIFGDSYAQLHQPLIEYSWPYRLYANYDVENFALEGTSVDYSLQKLYELVSGNYNKDGVVIFFMTDIQRQNWPFFHPQHQYLSSRIFDNEFYEEHKVMQKHINLYKNYADFAKTFFMQTPHPSVDISIEKNYAFINAYSTFFSKILIWPCFEKWDNKFVLNENVKVMAKPMMEIGGDDEQTDSFDRRINHLVKREHKLVTRTLVDWIEDGHTKI